MWKEWDMKNWQRKQMPRKWRGKEARKTEIAVGDCIERDLDRMGDELRKEQQELETADRERSEGKVSRRKKTIANGNHD